MFETKDVASTLLKGLELIIKQYIRLQRFARDKHYSLHCRRLSDEERGFKTLTLGVNVFKLLLPSSLDGKII